jgi:hypothetical protein
MAILSKPTMTRQARCPARFPILLFAAIAVLLSGCSSFRSSKSLDMGRFAEDMIAVAGEIQYSLGQHQAVYLRDYMDTPEIAPLQYAATRAKSLVRGVIAYSIQLVTVGDSRKPDSEKADALAGYFEEVLPPVIEGPGPTLGLTRAELDTVLADIRAQQRYLDAIAAAQPVVDEIAIVSGGIFDDLKTAIDRMTDALREQIEDRYRDVRLADRILAKRQIQTVYNLAYLPQIRSGTPGAIDSLLAHEPSLPLLVNVDDGIDAEEILRIETRMIDVLTGVRLVREQLEPDIEMYYKEMNELDQMTNVWNAELRKARVSIVAWARAHKRMAQGVTNPADIDVLGIARKASGTVLPIP